MLGDVQLLNLRLHSARGERLAGETNAQRDCTVERLAAQVRREPKAHGECQLHVPAVRLHLRR
jgi:hypothetical protein